MLREQLDLIKLYNKARLELESRFHGLPHAHSLLIYSLISLSDPKTGIVDNIQYSDLVTLLSVKPLSGRSTVGGLIKQTIRSYLRTIEKFCPEHFQIASEGQQLIIKFPTLPSIYAECFKNTVLYTDENTNLPTLKNLDNTDQKPVLENQLNTDEYTEEYTDLYIGTEPAKNNNIFNINKKQQHTTHSGFSISDDFYPSEKNHCFSTGERIFLSNLSYSNQKFHRLQQG